MSSIKEDQALDNEDVAKLMHDLAEIDALTKKPILELSNEEALSYFLKSESYCNFHLPDYIVFDKLLNDVNTIILSAKDFSFLATEKDAQKYDNVNYTLLGNKDGRYAWRPLQFIHPALYVSLARKITEKESWDFICNRFREFKRSKNIHCLSIPVESMSDRKDQAEQIFNWWTEVEQQSIELSLKYTYLLETDITDCYGSIYTHSIAWALHGKKEAKENRNDDKLIGNMIDNKIKAMRHGQTNGIPQGSTLMDFIAEMVLGYADLELAQKIQKEAIEDYCILRYRDDYRIFVNNPQDGEKILKFLTETMFDLGMKLNISKTKISSHVIQSSIKKDKLAWVLRKESNKGLQKALLIIHDHANQFPNAGSLVRPLNKYYDRILGLKKSIRHVIPLISIVVDIAYNNPRTYPNCAALLSKLLEFLETDKEKKEIVEKIYDKFKQIPHTGHLKVWLQRATLEINKNNKSDEKICALISSPKAVISLWNMEWISSKELKEAINAQNIINRQGYTLALMQDLPRTKIPERRKLYIEKEGEQLKYIVKTPLDKIEEGYIDINGCDLLLMSDLPKTGPKKGKMYLEKKGARLKYIVITPEGKEISDFLDISIDELTTASLALYSDAILNVTSKKGHTHVNISELTAESLVLHKSRILAETSKRGHTNRKKALDEVSSVIPPEEIEYFLDDRDS